MLSKEADLCADCADKRYRKRCRDRELELRKALMMDDVNVVGYIGLSIRAKKLLHYFLGGTKDKDGYEILPLKKCSPDEFREYVFAGKASVKHLLTFRGAGKGTIKELYEWADCSRGVFTKNVNQEITRLRQALVSIREQIDIALKETVR
jgi:hypothetical protein